MLVQAVGNCTPYERAPARDWSGPGSRSIGPRLGGTSAAWLAALRFIAAEVSPHPRPRKPRRVLASTGCFRPKLYILRAFDALKLL